MSTLPSPANIRNVAIIAHIDHGKTTLIDTVLRQSGTFRDNAAIPERVMDNYELERERGITIRAKHCSVRWRDYLINIVDTPGHADFSGEVERTLALVDSALLIVDANEGPMPQTRYVLMRALKRGFRPIVFINKVDRAMASPQEALNKTFDLFIELGATEEQCDFPVLYGSGLHGWCTTHWEPTEPPKDLTPLFETLVKHVPAPTGEIDAPFLMQVASVGWREHFGRTATGRILQGTLRRGMTVRRLSVQFVESEHAVVDVHTERAWEVTQEGIEKISHVWVASGIDSAACDNASVGDIVTIGGPKDLQVGDTLTADETAAALPPLEIDEPTVSTLFIVNTGPFAGQEGTAATLRQLRSRLEVEARSNVALRVEETTRSDAVKVCGRGELHLAILIEEMRREGLEFCVSRPEIITKRSSSGELLEPIEELILVLPSEFQGIALEKVAARKGELRDVHMDKGGLLRFIFHIPTRGLFGFRNEYLTETRGRGLYTARYSHYAPWRGPIQPRTRGAMVSLDTGEATAYSLLNLQQRGTLFIEPGEKVYAGMVVGEHSRPGDLPCNPVKKKMLTNHRASTKEQTVVLDVPRRLTLEAALEWIAEDEWVEVTPLSVRVRKAILDLEARKREKNKAVTA